jgi:plasmid stabilization system protein ParE
VTIYFTPRARDDIREILDYLNLQSPTAAEHVRQSIVATLNLLAQRPHVGIRNAKAPELRSFLVSRCPYRIHYLVEKADLWIVHIRHSARRPFDIDTSD